MLSAEKYGKKWYNYYSRKGSECMVLTSIAKLQKDYDSLRKKYIRQTDLLAERREK